MMAVGISLVVDVASDLFLQSDILRHEANSTGNMTECYVNVRSVSCGVAYVKSFRAFRRHFRTQGKPGRATDIST